MYEMIEEISSFEHGVSKKVVEEGFQLMSDELRWMEQSLIARIEEHVINVYEEQAREIQAVKSTFE